MHAYVLREEEFPGYNWNVGDRLIHAGVDRVLNDLGVTGRSYVNRKRFTLPGPDETADILVYAGMPRFAAADRPNLDDQAWAMLRHRFAPPTRAIDLGCGTGYALQVNRLRVAASMAAERYNQWFLRAQSDVVYATRDPITLHFLRGLGLQAELGICPSFLAETPAPRPSRPDVAIAIVQPDIKFDRSQRDRLGFDFADLIRALRRAFPEGPVICQEPQDVAWASSIGITDVVLPATLEAFMAACGNVRTLISTRVHASVCAFNQGARVLHFAIDGRSDLLTPLLMGGLAKVNLFQFDEASAVEAALRFVEGKVAPPAGWEATYAALRSRFVRSCQARLAKPIDMSIRHGNIVLNPEVSSAPSNHDTIMLTADRFGRVDLSLSDGAIVVPTHGNGDIRVYGPYLSLPAGAYEVTWDLEWWGQLTGLDCRITFDVASAGIVLTRQTFGIAELLTENRLPRQRFSNPSRAAGLEFRIAVEGTDTGLTMAFQGITLRPA